MKADTFMDAVDKLAKQDYFDRRNKKIAITQAVDNSRGGIMSRINSADKDIIFGKFNIETGKIESGVRYNKSQNIEIQVNNLINEYKQIKNDTNSADRINQIEQELLNITGIEVQYNGTIFDFVTEYHKRDITKYGRILDQISVINNIETKIDNKEYTGKIKYDNNAKDKVNAREIFDNLDNHIIKSPNGDNIQISKKGIEKTLNSLRRRIKNSTNYKNALLYTYENIENVVQKGIITKENVISYKKNNSNKYDYILGSIEIANDTYIVLANIQKARAHSTLYLTELDLVKIKRAVETRADKNQPSWVNYTTSPTNNIQQDNENVKTTKKVKSKNVRYSKKLNKQTPNAKNFIDAVAKVLEPELSIESGIWDRIEKEVMNNFALTNMRPDKQQLWNAFYEFRDEIGNVAKY